MPAGMGLKLGYGVGIVGPMLGWVAASQYLLYFYTEVVGLSPRQAGLVFAVGMVWDALSDPIIGGLADRTRSRWGRYRSYLLWGSVPYGLCLPLAFLPITGAAALPLVLLTHILFRTLYTVVYMPYTAMLSAISRDYDERTVLTSWKTIFIFLANLGVSLGFYTLVLALGGGSERIGFPAAAAVLSVLAVIAILTCYFSTKGRESMGPAEVERTGVGTIFKDLFANRPFLLLFLGVVIYGGFYGAQISLTSYIAKYWLGDPGLTRYLFTAQALTALASVPLWAYIGKRTSKRLVWQLGATLAATGLIAIFLIRPDDVWSLAALYGLSNAGSTGFIVVMFAMTADVVDWSGSRSGRRNEGVVFGAIALANKFANGVFTGVASALLAMVGFITDREPTAETMDGIFAIATLAPAMGFLTTAAFMSFYPISRAVHAQLQVDQGLA